MYRKIVLSFFVVISIAALLVACGPAPTPSSGPEQPAATVQPEQPIPYPGPNTPVTSEDPSLNPYPSPLSPQAGDEKLTRGNVFIDAAEILTLESFPPQFNLVLMGNLPTPCNELRYINNEPDAQKRINIEVYSVVDPNTICTQVLQPFKAAIALGSLPAGQYEVLVNGEKVADIMAP